MHGIGGTSPAGLASPSTCFGGGASNFWLFITCYGWHYLFTLYIDDLLMNLQSLGVGYYGNGLFTSAVWDADGLALLAPSPSALRIMIHCCKDLAVCCGLQFNPSKTQLIQFSNSHLLSCLYFFCGPFLSIVNSVTHIGHVLSSNLKVIRLLLLVSWRISLGS